MISTQGWLWVSLGSLAAASLFSALHISLRQVARASIEEAAGRRRESRPRTAAMIMSIHADTEGHALAAALPRAIFTMLFAVGMVGVVTGIGPGQTVGGADMAIGLLIAALLFWIMGIAVPTSVARHAGVQTIAVWSPLIRVTAVLCSPLSRVTAFFDEIVRRLAGDTKPKNTDILEAELLSVVEEHDTDGQLDHIARDMIEAVVEFGTTTVEEIMTPRTEVEAIAYTDELEKIKQVVRKVGHSRIPVYKGDLDHIVGILYAKDLLHWLSDPEQNGKRFVLRDILRGAAFVPETKTLRELLTELLAKRVHMAVAADEYGGVAGIVTIEDIVEEIFGEIEDEYEQGEERPSVDIDPEQSAAEIDARKHIDDANDALEAIGVELPEGEDYDTVGGFVVVTLGRIPEAGESFRHEKAEITVTEAEPTRVVRVRVVRVREESQAPEETPAVREE